MLLNLTPLAQLGSIFDVHRGVEVITYTHTQRNVQTYKQTDRQINKHIDLYKNKEVSNQYER